MDIEDIKNDEMKIVYKYHFYVIFCEKYRKFGGSIGIRHRVKRCLNGRRYFVLCIFDNP